MEEQLLEMFFGNMMAVSGILSQYYNDASATIRILKRSANLSDEDFALDFQFFLRTEEEVLDTLKRVQELAEAFQLAAQAQEDTPSEDTEEE